MEADAEQRNVFMKFINVLLFTDFCRSLIKNIQYAEPLIASCVWRWLVFAARGVQLLQSFSVLVSDGLIPGFIKLQILLLLYFTS